MSFMSIISKVFEDGGLKDDVKSVLRILSAHNKNVGPDRWNFN